MINPATSWFEIVELLTLQQELDIRLRSETGVMPGISYIPGTYQHSHWHSFAFFGQCPCGIPHIPCIYQLMSHLQKIHICIYIRRFVVMYEFMDLYALDMPGFWELIQPS